MNARQAAKMRKTICFATAIHHIRPPNTTMSSRKNAVLCGSNEHSGSRARSPLLIVAPRTTRVRPDPVRRVAVEVGFEPTEGLPLHTLSRRAPSATRRLHRRRAYRRSEPFRLPALAEESLEQGGALLRQHSPAHLDWRAEPGIM